MNLNKCLTQKPRELLAFISSIIFTLHQALQIQKEKGNKECRVTHISLPFLRERCNAQMNPEI
jgi:hypothetical protein